MTYPRMFSFKYDKVCWLVKLKANIIPNIHNLIWIGNRSLAFGLCATFITTNLFDHFSSISVSVATTFHFLSTSNLHIITFNIKNNIIYIGYISLILILYY